MKEQGNIYILFDCPDDKNDKKWLFEELKNADVGKVTSMSINLVLSSLFSSGKRSKYLLAIWIIFKQIICTLLKSRNGDFVICWSSMQGLLFNQISTFLGCRRNSICINWLTPKENSKWNRAYKSAATNPQVRIIVNSPESPLEWAVALGLDTTQQFYLIPDVYDTNILFEGGRKGEKEKYCYTGGMNNRNWKLIMQMAILLPNVKFVCVALEADFKRQVTSIPNNMTVYFDLPTDKYYELMRGAYLILLPLIDNSVAGLINILRAAQFHIPCVITKTASTQQYYSEKVQMLLLDDNLTSWIHIVQTFYNMDNAQYNTIANDFQNYIRKEFSPKQAVQKIVNIMASFN